MEKKTNKTAWSDVDVEQMVGNLLRYGVITASVVAIIGGILYLWQHGGDTVPSYHIFKGEGAGYTTFSGILGGAYSLQVMEVIQLGVLVLIATPILRIAFSLVAFAIEKDKLYIFITFVVLCIMLGSMFGGLKV